jgi:hypothetical protein
VLYVADGIDITQDIIALYDKNAPAPPGGAATPAPKPPAQAPKITPPPKKK